jgi:hypothetical protein
MVRRNLTMSEEWVETELHSPAVKDRRSRQALIRLGQRLAADPHASFSAACGAAGRQAARRLFRRPDTRVTDLLQGHYEQTVRRCAAHPLILVAQDTTELNYTHHPATQDLGPTTHPHGRGLFGHAALALTPAGEPLGLLHLDLWARPPARGQAATRRQRLTPEKESRKWGDGLASVSTRLPNAPEVLLIQDREGDVFAFLATPRPSHVQLLVRAAQARKVRVPGPPQGGGDAGREPPTLFAVAAAAAIAGTLIVTLPAKAGREAREAVLTVRVVALELQPPRHGKAAEPKTPQPVWVVHAREEQPPAGLPAAEVVQWVLVSTRPVPDAAAAGALVQYYALRWRIERLHYTLKSGCTVEDLQHETAADLQKALALYYVIAWRLLWLTYVARTEPTSAAGALLTPAELTVLRQQTGQPVGTAQEVVRAVARLAGWQGYRSAPDPGVKMLWLGLRRLTDMVTGWQLAEARAPDPIQP